MSTELIIGILYVLPLVISVVTGFWMEKNKIVRGVDSGSVYIGVGFVPAINIIIAICSVSTLLDHKDKIELPNFQRLSPEAREQIKKSKEHRDKEIARIKEECKTTIKEVKEEDEQKVLLGKLGLTMDDLESLKALKKGAA